MSTNNNQKKIMPPCQAACPIHQDVQGYVKSIAAGKFKEAAQIILTDNPLPSVCGRICAHPCTDSCTRGKLDQPVNIPGLKRFAMEYLQDYVLPKPDRERSEKIAVVGSGPAGLLCAYKLRQSGYQVKIFEALPVAGGMMRVGIPDFRLPPDVLEREIQLILDTGIEMQLNTQIGKDITLNELRSSYKAVFIAIGAHIDIPLGIVGENLIGVTSGVDFLRRVNLGQEVKVGEKVLVVGGGNSAIDVARTARRYGASTMVVYRRTRNEMPADEAEIEEALKEGVVIHQKENPTSFDGDCEVAAMTVIKMKLGELDSSGRPRPVPIEGSEFKIECDDVFYCIGQSPDLDGLGELIGLDVSRWGTFKINELTMETNIPGVFAGGDCVSGPDVVVKAMQAGIKAAESIDRYCRGIDLKEDRFFDDMIKGNVMVDEVINLTKKQVQIQHIPVEERGLYDEVSTGYLPEQAQTEAFRCMNCILPDSVIEHRNTMDMITKALQEGMTTIEEIAQNTNLSKKETFWHILAMVKYGNVTYEKRVFDCFTYAIKEKE